VVIAPQLAFILVRHARTLRMSVPRRSFGLPLRTAPRGLGKPRRRSMCASYIRTERPAHLFPTQAHTWSPLTMCAQGYTQGWRLSRTLQFKAISSPAVSYSRHTADGPQFIWVNVKIVDDVFGKVKSQHFSEDQTASVGLLAYRHYLRQPAFHLHPASATRSGLTRSLGMGVSPESSNSSRSGGTVAEHSFIFPAKSSETIFRTNSRVSKTFLNVSLMARPALGTEVQKTTYRRVGTGHRKKTERREIAHVIQIQSGDKAIGLGTTAPINSL
jgi:hypothetical protein